MKLNWPVILLLITAMACTGRTILEKLGRHYQLYQDAESLQQAVERINLGADTAYVRHILGEPIDMGFDYRYLIDSTGPGGCVVGAVFHIDAQGKIDDKWIGEICE